MESGLWRILSATTFFLKQVIKQNKYTMEEKLEKILLDLNIGYFTVKAAKTKILKLIKKEEQKSNLVNKNNWES
jgi:hypothetical protein